MRGICWGSIPGPESCTLTRYLESVTRTIFTHISGRIPASSQASSELSTASFTVVNNAFRGLSNPNRCLFFAKNSLTEISFCALAIDAESARRRRVGEGLASREDSTSSVTSVGSNVTIPFYRAQ